MSDLRFARPNFLSGVARIFDFSGSLNEYNGMPTEELAEELAERMDTAALAEDGRLAWATVQRIHSIPGTERTDEPMGCVSGQCGDSRYRSFVGGD